MSYHCLICLVHWFIHPHNHIQTWLLVWCVLLPYECPSKNRILTAIFPQMFCFHVTSWWLNQPTWKMCVKNGIFSQGSGWKWENIWLAITNKTKTPGTPHVLFPPRFWPGILDWNLHNSGRILTFFFAGWGKVGIGVLEECRAYNTHTAHTIHVSCMVDLPTFGWFLW